MSGVPAAAPTGWFATGAAIGTAAGITNLLHNDGTDRDRQRVVRLHVMGGSALTLGGLLAATALTPAPGSTKVVYTVDAFERIVSRIRALGMTKSGKASVVVTGAGVALLAGLIYSTAPFKLPASSNQ